MTNGNQSGNPSTGGVQIRGSIPAIITPMLEDGSLDLPAFRKLIDWHIAEGTNGLVVVGTSGESATLSVEEHVLMVKTAVEHTAGRIPVIAGSGGKSPPRQSNSRNGPKRSARTQRCRSCRTTTSRLRKASTATSPRSP